MTTDFLHALILVSAFLSFFVAAYALHQANEARIKVEAMERSTHNIQYVPIDPKTPFDDDGDDDAEINKKLKFRDEDAWDNLQDMDAFEQRGVTPLA